MPQTLKPKSMISHIRSGIQTDGKVVYNLSLVQDPSGQIELRYSTPVQSKKKDSRELKDILAAERRRQHATENGAGLEDYKFQLQLAWFLLKKICGVGSAIATKYPKTKISPGDGLLSKGKNFTKKAKRDLINGAAAMELELGKERCKFITLTIPGDGNQRARIIAANSAWLTHRLNVWVKDNFEHSNGKVYVIGVLEHQKRGMLHWHILVGLESFFYYEKLSEGMSELWFNLLTQLSKKYDVNLFENCDGVDNKAKWNVRGKRGKTVKEVAVRVEHIKKSVGNYLAKYLSKTTSKNVKAIHYRGEKREIYFPSSWWTKTRDVDDLIAKHRNVWLLNPLIEKSFESIDDVMATYKDNPDSVSLLDECVDFARDIFKSFGFWTVDMINPFTKNQMGVLGRGKYEDAKECAGILAGILNEVCRHGRLDVDNQYKTHHSEVNRLAKELRIADEQAIADEAIENAKTSWAMRRKRKPHHKIHKDYWSAIEQGISMRDAFLCAGMD